MKRQLASRSARDPRPVGQANASLLAWPRKALRASAGACNVLPTGAEFVRCHLLSSGRLFSVGLAASRPGSPDIGSARGAEVCGDSKPGRKQPHPKPLAGRKTGNQSEPWPPPMWRAPAAEPAPVCTPLRIGWLVASAPARKLRRRG